MTEGSSGVGPALAQARESRGLTLVDVAQQLRLAPRQIEALEQERFEALPGPTIARGMLRNYARLLELDAEALLQRVGERLDAPDAERLAARFRQAVPFSDTARRSTLLYVGLSVAVLVFVMVLGYQWREERTATPALAFVPAAKVPVEPAPRLPAADPVPAPSVTVAESVPAPSVPVAEPAPTPTKEPPPEPPAEPAAKSAATTPESVKTQTALVSAAPPAEAVRQLVLRCQEESWVEVTDGLDRVLVWQLLPAGAERVVEGQPPFSVVLGNARHVELTYDGRPVDLAPRTRGDVARLTLK